MRRLWRWLLNDETRMTAEAWRDVYGAMETNDDGGSFAGIAVGAERDLSGPADTPAWEAEVEAPASMLARFLACHQHLS